MLQEEILKALTDGYRASFDIHSPYSLCNRELLAYCRFSSRSEKYVLIKRAVIWAAESNEHVLILDIPRLDRSAVSELSEYLESVEKACVEPHKDHMVWLITLFLLVGEMDRDGKTALKRLRFGKNYKFTVHGYSSARAVALNPNTWEFVSNAAGKTLIPYFQKRLAALISHP